VSGIAPARLVDADSGRVLIERLELATSFWRRFCGWQFRALPPPGAGILLAPCNSIHTFWMRFAIDVVFLDTEGVVQAVKLSVAPWRIVWPVAKARAVLEFPAGRITLTPGQRLAVAAGPPSTVLAGFPAWDAGDSLSTAGRTTDTTHKVGRTATDSPRLG
jgi:uncharacterized membrane protein (UPF0127 family)